MRAGAGGAGVSSCHCDCDTPSGRHPPPRGAKKACPFLLSGAQGAPPVQWVAFCQVSPAPGGTLACARLPSSLTAAVPSASTGKTHICPCGQGPAICRRPSSESCSHVPILSPSLRPRPQARLSLRRRELALTVFLLSSVPSSCPAQPDQFCQQRSLRPSTCALGRTVPPVSLRPRFSTSPSTALQHHPVTPTLANSVWGVGKGSSTGVAPSVWLQVPHCSVYPLGRGQCPAVNVSVIQQTVESD